MIHACQICFHHRVGSYPVLLKSSKGFARIAASSNVQPVLFDRTSKSTLGLRQFKKTSRPFHWLEVILGEGVQFLVNGRLASENEAFVGTIWRNDGALSLASLHIDIRQHFAPLVINLPTLHRTVVKTPEVKYFFLVAHHRKVSFRPSDGKTVVARVAFHEGVYHGNREAFWVEAAIDSIIVAVALRTRPADWDCLLLVAALLLLGSFGNLVLGYIRWFYLFSPVPTFAFHMHADIWRRMGACDYIGRSGSWLQATFEMLFVLLV